MMELAGYLNSWELKRSGVLCETPVIHKAAQLPLNLYQLHSAANCLRLPRRYREMRYLFKRYLALLV